jgi:CheY-like chemotaxis protein
MTELSQVVDILLVENNEDDVVLIREAFADARLVNIVHVVRDGEEALAYLRCEGPYRDAARPGLVLLDIAMPKKNGFETLHDMRTDPTLRTIPVVMLTTSRREEDIAHSYAEGACSFISKPVRVEQLHEVLKQFALYWVLVSKVPGRS